jgi:hypothetical protein
MSEARKFSPSPRPDHQRALAAGPDDQVGLERPASPPAPGRPRPLHHLRTASASGGRPSPRSCGPPPRCRCRLEGVPVGDELRLRAAQFSMIPLWTTTTSTSSRCGGGRWWCWGRRGWPSGCGRCRTVPSATGSGHQALQVGDPTGRLTTVDAVTAVDGHSRRVVSPVFEPGQARQQDVDHRTRPTYPTIPHMSKAPSHSTALAGTRGRERAGVGPAGTGSTRWASVPESLRGLLPSVTTVELAGKASAECFDDLPPRHLGSSREAWRCLFVARADCRVSFMVWFSPLFPSSRRRPLARDGQRTSWPRHRKGLRPSPSPAARSPTGAPAPGPPSPSEPLDLGDLVPQRRWHRSMSAPADPDVLQHLGVLGDGLGPQLGAAPCRCRPSHRAAGPR